MSRTPSHIPEAYIDCIPCFAPEVDIHDRRAVVQYVQDLMTFRAKARAHPLHGGWTFTASLKPHPPHPSLSSHRVLPSFAKLGGRFRFVLLRALQPMDFSLHDLWQWSQVWVARVEREDGNGNNEHEDSEVVLKILQPSVLPLPDLEEEHPYRHLAFAKQIANTEDLIYGTRLQTVQGLAVPYYFGDVKVSMPNGEDARVLFLEYIKGKTLAEWSHDYRISDDLGKTRCIREFEAIIPAIHRSYDSVNSCGVFHMDVSPKNIIIRETSESKCAVIVDFGHSGVMPYADIQKVAKAMKESEGDACVHTTRNWFADIDREGGVANVVGERLIPSDE